MLDRPSCHHASDLSEGQLRKAFSEIQACSRSLLIASPANSSASAAGSIELSMRTENALKFLTSSISTERLDAMTRIFGFLLICVGMQFLLTGISDFYGLRPG